MLIRSAGFQTECRNLDTTGPGLDYRHPGPRDLSITSNVLLLPVASNNRHGTFHIVNATALNWFIETTLVGRLFNPKGSF